MTSHLATPAATLAVLERHGLRTKKSLGQHFLVDDNVIGRIMALADLAPGDIALEVGPGIGTLTVALGAEGHAVIAVERDTDLLPALADTTSELERFALVRADATTVSIDALSEPFGAPTSLVANLPYQVAATVVLRFFEEIPSLKHATVMVQTEVADRMAAVPGTKSYGAYTVKLRLHASPAGRFAVSRTCFLPPPRVDSTVIRLERHECVGDESLRRAAARVADAAFAQRRKTVRNSLRATLGISATELDAALDAAGIDGSLRAETLEPLRFVRLAEVLAPSLHCAGA